MNNLTKKWEKTGLLKQLHKHEVERMAEWLEEICRQFLEYNPDWGKKGQQQVPGEERGLVNIFFPIQRRVRRWQITPDFESRHFCINGIKSKVSWKNMKQMGEDMTAHCGLDAEFEMVQIYSMQLTEEAKKLFSLDAIVERNFK